MEISNKCISVVVLVVCVVIKVDLVSAEAETQTDWTNKMSSVIFRAIDDCEDNLTESYTAADCLKSKALKAMDRALKYGSLSFGDGFTLVRKPGPRGARALPPIEETPNPDSMDDLLAGRAERLLETSALQVPLTSLLGMDIKDVVSGRGKMKKMAGPAILIMIMAAYKLAMLMAGIAMLSGKALIVSKVALTLAGVAILKKLLSNGEGHEKTTVEIVKAPQVSHSHTYSSNHDDHHHDYGHHEKSWTVPSSSSHFGQSGSVHYSHRSSFHDVDPMEYPSGPAGNSESSESTPPVYANRRSFKMGNPPTIDAVRISGPAPLRVVLAAPSLLTDEEPPMSDEYTQFGVADTGAWRGLGSTGSVDRSIGSNAGSEFSERAGKGEMIQTPNTEYHPRSLWSSQISAATA